jgi:hypothetical protein
MKTRKVPITDQNGIEISESKALVWGNNAAWLCIECKELLGNRTGDTEYQVECAKTGCNSKYEIERSENR